MSALDEMKEFHWMMNILQNINVGIVVLDKKFDIHIWNGFMEANSGLLPSDVRGQNLFKVFPEIDRDWFISKAKTVFELKINAFTLWQQNPHLFKFKQARPITGVDQYMYQNVTFSPLISTTQTVDYMSVMIHDVTDSAALEMQKGK